MKNLFFAISFAILLVCSNSTLYAQVIVTKLNSREITQNDPVVSTVYPPKRATTHSKETLVLSNGLVLNNYSIFKFNIQSKPEPSKYDTLSLLVGFKSPYLVMIADQNYNNTFTDDTVGTTSLLVKYNDYIDFRNSLPSVTVDSVRIMDDLGIQTFKPLTLKFTPSPGNGDFFRDTVAVRSIKEFSLEAFSLGYFISDPFILESKKYIVKISPDPFVYSLYPVKASIYSRATIFLVDEAASNKFLASGLLEFILKEKQSLKFSGKKAEVVSINLTGGELTLRITLDENIAEIISPDVLSKLNLYSLVEKKTIKLNLQKTPLTVIDFTGSWCKPCVEIMPKVKALQKRLDRKITFYTVDVEKDISLAKRFILKNKLTGHVLFEQLNCEENGCLTKLFSISGYPTFVVVNNKGQIVFKRTGDIAISELADFLLDYHSSK